MPAIPALSRNCQPSLKVDVDTSSSLRFLPCCQAPNIKFQTDQMSPRLFQLSISLSKKAEPHFVAYRCQISKTYSHTIQRHEFERWAMLTIINHYTNEGTTVSLNHADLSTYMVIMRNR
jgi:hypothetical protein